MEPAAASYRGWGRTSDCINVLLRRGFDIQTRDKLDNATALHWAAQFGTVEIVKRLIDAGADVDGGDEHQIGVIALGDLVKQGAWRGSRLSPRPRC